MSKDERLKIMMKVAWEHLGLPYIWGGDDPILGFDCSGFVIECLKSVGLVNQGYDNTAAGIWSERAQQRVETPYEGCLVFYRGSSGNIVHIELCLNDTLSIGASGGGSANTNAAKAAASNAYIKIHPWAYRSGVAGFVDPFLGVA